MPSLSRAELFMPRVKSWPARARRMVRLMQADHLSDLDTRELPIGGFPEFGSFEGVKVIGMSNCRFVRGFHRHARSAANALPSSIPNPVNFDVRTRAGRPLAGFIVTRNTPRPWRRCNFAKAKREPPSLIGQHGMERCRTHTLRSV